MPSAPSAPRLTRARRRLASALALTLSVPVLSALPVVTPPAAQAHPVTPQVRALPLSGVDPAALRSQGTASAAAAAHAHGEAAPEHRTGRLLRAAVRPAVLTPARYTSSFSLLGVTWLPVAAGDLTVAVRAHGDGGWSEWTELHRSDGPDAAEAAARVGTDPLWVGPSDGYQVRVDVSGGSLPTGLRVDLVDPGTSAADDAVSARPLAASAAAAASRPAIFTRAQWGADERLRSGSPSYNSTIKAGFVHHTVSANKYSEGEVPKMIRGIYAYHTQSNGWSDVGYNFLVDRFGRLWEGRAGGMDRAVVGAHAGGFNEDTFGVSAIGNFETAAAPDAMVDAIGRLMAWKLSMYYRNPQGTTTLTSAGGGTSRYPAGARVRFSVVSGHRDSGYTACPGRRLYARMPDIRERAATFLGAGLVVPSASRSASAYGGSPVRVGARVLREQRWRLDVRARCTGTLVRRLSGSAAPGTPIAVTWDLRDGAGAWARAGVYDLVLSSWDDAGSARPWSRAMRISRTASNAAVAPKVAMPGASRFVPLQPARLYDSRPGSRQPLAAGGRVDVPVLGEGGVPANGVGAVALNVTATCTTAVTAVTVWPAGAKRPGSPTVHVGGGGSRTSLAISPVGGNGSVSVYNAVGLSDVVVDVVGYFPNDGDGTLFHTATRTRIFDSRADGGRPLADGESRVLTMPTLSGVDGSSMRAAVVNVTALGGDGSGYVTLNPGQAESPATMTLTHRSAGAVSVRSIARLSSGRFGLRNTGVPSHVVVDVIGWYAPASVSGGMTFRPVVPKRVLDTRSGLGARAGKVQAGRNVSVLVEGAGKPIPADAQVAVMSVTATEVARRTWVTVWPSGIGRPALADFSVPARGTVDQLMLVRIGTNGRVRLYSSAGATHLVGDIVGYYS